MVKGQRTKARGATRRVWRKIYLEEWRGVPGLSVEALAAKAGVSPALISLIENRKSAGSPESLEKLAEALNISLGQLFDPPPPAGEIAVRAWIKEGTEDRFAKLLELIEGKTITEL